MRVLVVEDEPRIAADIGTALKASGMVVDAVRDGDSAWFAGDTEDYDAVVLDLGLPRLDGLTVLKRWRANDRRFPVLVLTARGVWTERVEGINAGADDYLPKPFEMEELLARLRALSPAATGVHCDKPLGQFSNQAAADYNSMALAAGPILVFTTHHTVTLPWARLWTLPIARSAEPSRFIVFGLLALSIALALWLASPKKAKPASREPKATYKLIAGRLLLAGRWGLGLLAVAAVITDTPTSYQAVNPLPQYYKPPATLHAANQLPAFITQGLYRQYLRPGEIVAVFTQRGNAGMLFQAAANFYFRIAGGYINASLTPVNAVPHPLTAVANPNKVADQMLADYLRSAGVGAILVEQAWEDPWMHNMVRLGFRGTSVGGVIVYPVAPWLAHRAKSAGGSPRAVSSSPCGLPFAARPENSELIAPVRDCGFTLRDRNARAPVGMGSQKLTTRHPSTPSVAVLRVTPKPTSSSGVIESTTPRPPGVSGSAPATLAMP